ALSLAQPLLVFFFFSSRRRHTRCLSDWSSDVCSSELAGGTVPEGEELPVLLAVSDNGPQMTSQATATFMAGARIAQHFGRPGTPNDQAWIESLFGHVKTEFPHLDKIVDPGELEA